MYTPPTYLIPKELCVLLLHFFCYSYDLGEDTAQVVTIKSEHYL